MEPLEYCSLYINCPKLGEEGYRAACVKALVAATFGVYSQQSISKKWGTQFEHRPPAALKILEVAHTINSIHIMLEQIHPLFIEQLKQVSQVAPYKQHK